MFSCFMSINIKLIHAFICADRALKHDVTLQKYITSWLPFLNDEYDDDGYDDDNDSDDDDDDKSDDYDDENQLK